MEIQEFVKFKNWIVIGDINNESKYANMIFKKLKDKGYEVSGVHPNEGKANYTSIKGVPYKIDAIDLCINPKLGLEFIKEAKKLKIKNVLIQPGAESEEILSYCKENSINAVEGCALVLLSVYKSNI